MYILRLHREKTEGVTTTENNERGGGEREVERTFIVAVVATKVITTKRADVDGLSCDEDDCTAMTASYIFFSSFISFSVDCGLRLNLC